MSHKSTNTSKKPARSAVVFALFGIVLLVAVIFFMVILKSQQHSGQTANLDSPNNPTGLGLQSVGGQHNKENPNAQRRIDEIQIPVI